MNAVSCSLQPDFTQAWERTKPMLAWTLVFLLSGALPRPLVQLESATEDLGDAAEHGHWRRAQELLAASRRDPHQLQGTAADPTALGALEADLTQAAGALARHDRWGAARAANLASAEVVKLYRPHHPAVPIEVMQLDGLTQVPTHATAAVDQAISLWKELRKAPPLYQTPTAKRFDAQLAGVDDALRAADAHALARAAGQALEGVDALERAFASALKKGHPAARIPGR
jgi:hypothetical protein